MGEKPLGNLNPPAVGVVTTVSLSPEQIIVKLPTPGFVY